MTGAPADYSLWRERDASPYIAVPREDDDKYTRGVLGIITGSDLYPGAAVLGVEAALRTGVGMVRYLGPRRAGDLILARRPETVTGNGRVQAWLIGSGMDATAEDGDTSAVLQDAAAQHVPFVLDGGALHLVGDAQGPVILTPHFRELARVTGDAVGDIAADPGAAAAAAAEKLGATVLLKGHTTYIASPDGSRFLTRSAPAWLATAGAGDALAGILGALVATHSDEILADPALLAKLGATAAVIHGLAARRASAGGPLTILDLAGQVSPTIAALLAT